MRVAILDANKKKCCTAKRKRNPTITSQKISLNQPTLSGDIVIRRL